MAIWNRKKQEPSKPKPKRADTGFYGAMASMPGMSDHHMGAAMDKSIQAEPPIVDGVAMDSMPRIPLQTMEIINPVQLEYFSATGAFIGYQAMSVIAQNWLVRKGCETKPRDAVRNWYEIESDGDELTPEQIKQIEKLDRKYKLRANVVEACTFNNIFGIRHVMFKHTDPNFDYSKPFNPDEFRDGKYAGISQIDPLWMTPEFKNEDLLDPTSINYMVPTWWNVQGKKIHRSHMVVLTGDMVPDLLKPTYRYGGVSKVQKVYERVYAAEITANEAPKLTMTKRLTWRQADLDKVAAKPTLFARAMARLTEYRDNYGVQLVGKDETLGQLDTSLSDLDAVIKGQYQIVCGVFDTPASKLMGTGHTGFSTGETDNDYYIETLEELQANDMTEVIHAHYRRLIPSFASDLGINPDTDVTPDWLPMKVLSDGDIADINLKNRQADLVAFQSQAIDNIELRERLMNDPYSGFDNLAEYEDIDETLPTETDADGQETT